MTEIPLFPLSAVLLPYGQMPLQIFEQRYLDLVRDCMKGDYGFGVVWIRRGEEVSRPGIASTVLGDTGTLARIIDWDQLDNGLLGITIQGQHSFTLQSTAVRANGLVTGTVTEAPAPEPEPVIDAWQPMVEVLQSLATHPHVQRMGLDIDYQNAWQVAYILTQLLPLEEALKYDLLCAADIHQLMAQLDIILNQISGED